MSNLTKIGVVLSLHLFIFSPSLSQAVQFGPGIDGFIVDTTRSSDTHDGFDYFRTHNLLNVYVNDASGAGLVLFGRILDEVDVHSHIKFMRLEDRELPAETILIEPNRAFTIPPRFIRMDLRNGLLMRAQPFKEMPGKGIHLRPLTAVTDSAADITLVEDPGNDLVRNGGMVKFSRHHVFFISDNLSPDDAYQILAKDYEDTDDPSLNSARLVTNTNHDDFSVALRIAETKDYFVWRDKHATRPWSQYRAKKADELFNPDAPSFQFLFEWSSGSHFHFPLSDVTTDTDRIGNRLVYTCHEEATDAEINSVCQQRYPGDVDECNRAGVLNMEALCSVKLPSPDQLDDPNFDFDELWSDYEVHFPLGGHGVVVGSIRVTDQYVFWSESLGKGGEKVQADIYAIPVEDLLENNKHAIIKVASERQCCGVRLVGFRDIDAHENVIVWSGMDRWPEPDEPKDNAIFGARLPWRGVELPIFLRGDANSDGEIDVSDPSFIVNYLYQAGDVPECLDAADANDDGLIDQSDAVFLNTFMYNAGEAPPAPFPDEGIDPTDDNLTCLGGLGGGGGGVPEFLRGDVDGDGSVEESDHYVLYDYVYAGEDNLTCLDAADINDDGVIDETDWVDLIYHLYLAYDTIAEPFPDPGVDPTTDNLDCADY